MTFDEYIKNPMGSKSTVMTNLQLYKQLYTEKWNNIMVRENGIVNYKLYHSGEDYYAHFKIPSEVVPKFYYDVVVRLFPPKDKTMGVIRTLSEYDVQFYSNDPNFVFTFAHAFKKHDMLIKDLESKMSITAIKEKATSKNPKDEIGYVKSLYFLYLAMKSFNLFKKSQWDAVSSPYTKKIWATVVTHADDKIRDRQEQGNALVKKEKRLTSDKTTASQRQAPAHAGQVKFSSPNKKNFGHFKRANYNNDISKPKHGKNGFRLFKSHK